MEMSSSQMVLPHPAHGKFETDWETWSVQGHYGLAVSLATLVIVWLTLTFSLLAVYTRHNRGSFATRVELWYPKGLCQPTEPAMAHKSNRQVTFSLPEAEAAADRMRTIVPVPHGHPRHGNSAHLAEVRSALVVF